MSSKSFLEQLQQLSREDLLELLKEHDPKVYMQVRRIEKVFETKLTHLNWPDGSPIDGRPLTVEELSLLIDEPFRPNPDLKEMGLSIEDQKQVHIAKDAVLWAKHVLKAEPRAYQILMLRHPSVRKVLRAGRRLGKTWTMAVLLLHFAWTHKDGRALVVAPMKSHVELIYQEIMRLAKESDMVYNAISRNVTSPQFMIEFTNGSTIRFFTTGMRSGGKSDVARGQEAHIIVLDELDYMGPDDLDALYAMLQKTADNQDEKILVGASTPTGRREKFWEWCTDKAPVEQGGKGFTEFWFPSYVNPHFDKKTEMELRAQYSEMVFRHEMEADWGEDTEGVYPRRYVDLAFKDFRKEGQEGPAGWDYKPFPEYGFRNSFYVIGVDWNKYSAGTNMVVLEVCSDEHQVEEYAGKIRLAYREEIPKDEYSLTKAIERVKQLNEIFQPRHIYVDRGYGEVQIEQLHKWGVEHPETGLRKKLEGINSAEPIEIRDPASKQIDKKDGKPFMVDNLRQYLEREQLIFPMEDERKFRRGKSLYMQLISYVVLRTTPTGKPIFEASGTAEDHAHDALALACLAITKNYGELMRLNLARRAVAISNEAFLPTFELSDDEQVRAAEEEVVAETWGEKSAAPISVKRSLTVKLNKRTPTRPIRRKTF